MQAASRGVKDQFSNPQTQLAEKLEYLLADHFALYVKTLNCHWNVVDPRFHFLHKMFEEQYLSLADQNDELAERIRQLNNTVNASIGEFSNKISLKEIRNHLTADQMLDSMIDSYEEHISDIKSVINRCDPINDVSTIDLLTEIARSLEKTLWMLRSHR